MTRASSPRPQRATPWTVQVFNVPEETLYLTPHARQLALQVMRPLCSAQDALPRGEQLVAEMVTQILQAGPALPFCARLDLHRHACRLQRLLERQCPDHPFARDLDVLTLTLQGQGCWLPGRHALQDACESEAGPSTCENPSGLSELQAIQGAGVLLRYLPSQTASLSFKLRVAGRTVVHDHARFGGTPSAF